MNKARLGFANYSYKRALSILERYFKKYYFDEDLMYQLGMLYDHLGQRFRYLSSSSNSGIKKRNYLKKSNQYFHKALDTYRSMLKENPRSYFALYGIGKVYRGKRNFKKALLYSKKAYRISKGDISGIGVIYQKMGNDKMALYWHKKELKDRGENDYGALINLVSFSHRLYQERMRKYALRLKRHFDKESMSFRKSEWGRSLKRMIEAILEVS